MTPTQTQTPPACVRSLTPTEPLEELVQLLDLLRLRGELTPCVGKYAAALVVQSGLGDAAAWTDFGVRCATATHASGMAAAFRRLRS